MASTVGDMMLNHPAVRDLTGQVIKTEYIAHGGNSDVWKGKWKDDYGEVFEVAVKVMKGMEDHNTHRRLLREVQVWAGVKHRNISPLLGIFFDVDRPRVPCLITPYHHHGDIARYIERQANIDKLGLITQTADGLSYLHGMDVIHGDIKGSNILINDQGEVSLSDFGLARMLHTSGFTTTTSKGTWRYWAPEMMAMEKEDGIQQVTAATDVYAFGMTIVEILTGRLPFANIKNDAMVVFRVMNGVRPRREECPQVTDSVWVMLEACWDADPNARPPMTALRRLQRD